MYPWSRASQLLAVETGDGTRTHAMCSGGKICQPLFINELNIQ